jgi:hypothetical protein
MALLELQELSHLVELGPVVLAEVLRAVNQRVVLRVVGQVVAS